MSGSPQWLSLEDAAAYLHLGKTSLYSLARHGRIPAQKLGKKWLFDRSIVDAWLRAAQPIESFFMNLDFNIENNPLLRDPQHDAYLRVRDYLAEGHSKAIVQIPVGCGKTGLAALLPLGIASGRVLIIAPNITIKNGLHEAMDISNRQKCFWRKAKILHTNQMIAGPFVTTLDSGNVTVASKSHIVITNIQQLSTNVNKWLRKFSPDFFDMIIVDEAHHSAAVSWLTVLDHFSNAKIIHMTATPFRSDRQAIDGELVYRYSFRSATLKGYIKRLKASYVAPSEIRLAFADKDGETYDLDDVMKLKEEDWFSRGIALAPLCNKHIVDSSLEKLEELRQTGTRHQLIAVACSIHHARAIRSLYRERGFSAQVLHSHQSEETRAATLQALRNGTLDCIVQVQMLGEGFDHSHLSVAAIFRPFRTLAPYIQFVGRILRVIVQNNPTHPDNLGHIVTHLGMNLDQRLKEFKEFESDDQAFWDSVIDGEEPEEPDNVLDGTARLRHQDDVAVFGEIVEALWEEDFLTADDQHIVEDLRERLQLLGLDPSRVAEMVKMAMVNPVRKGAPSEPFAVQPQREWEEARRRLNEQAQRSAKILLNRFKLSMRGTDLTYKYKTLKLSGKDNYISALMMVNGEIGKRLNKEREQASTEEFRSTIEELPCILDTLTRRVSRAKLEHEGENE